MSELKVLISREQIAQRVTEMGAQITRDFCRPGDHLRWRAEGRGYFSERPGARKSNSTATFDFIGVSSYGNRPSPAQELQHGWDSTGEVRLTKDVDQSMDGKNMILVEDILDTGLTLTFLKKFFCPPAQGSFKIAALLDKPSRRKCRSRPITWASRFQTNSWWAMGWIMPRNTGICPILHCAAGVGNQFREHQLFYLHSEQLATVAGQSSAAFERRSSSDPTLSETGTS